MAHSDPLAPSPTPSRAPARSERAPRSRQPLLIGLAGLVLFVAFGVSVAVSVEHPFTQGLDDAWRAVNGAGPGPESASWALPMFFQYLGEIPGAILTLILIPAWLFVVRRWRSAVFFITAELVGSLVVSQLTKNLVDRPRPADDLANGLFGPLFQVDHGSFPSGHAVSTGILIIAVAAILPAARRRIWWVVGALLAVGMVWQRTLINAHWLSDAVMGIVGGAAATLLLWWAFAPMLERDYGKPLFRRGTRAPVTEGELR